MLGGVDGDAGQGRQAGQYGGAAQDPLVLGLVFFFLKD